MSYYKRDTSWEHWMWHMIIGTVLWAHDMSFWKMTPRVGTFWSCFERIQSGPFGKDLATDGFFGAVKKMATDGASATKNNTKNNHFSKSFFQIDFRHTVFSKPKIVLRNRFSKSIFPNMLFHNFPQNRSSQSFSQIGFFSNMPGRH